MKQLFFFMFIMVISVLGSAQVVTTVPSIPTSDAEVEITFHAELGSGGLQDFSGDVYAHTGVITSESSGDSDWNYVVSGWGENIEKTKLTRVDVNTYTLSISPDIRSFYEVPEGEEILKMAFVFRSAEEVNGSWVEGKDEAGKDVFVDVYAAGLTAVIVSPATGALFDPGQLVEVEGQGQQSDLLELFRNGDLVASSPATSLNHSFSAPSEGSHQLVLTASDSESGDADTVNIYIKEAVVEEPMPAGLRKGVNVINQNNVTLLLQAPEKSFVYVLGDFNSWEPRPEAQMKKDGDMFWLTITGLKPGEEYAYQYYIDGGVKVADPYTSKVLDPWNDEYIPESIYPGLKPYPKADAAEGIVSVFTTTPEEYQWQTTDFTPAPTQELVIYEMLIRDFTANQDIKTVTDTLDYLQRLGVNAIELMPFNEFEGNDSWGYNPSFYFATDKAYGTLIDYKAFVDECHARGIAVIMDMVLNHSFSQSPLAQMYLEDGKPAANNPWYNRDHNMQNTDAQWGYDFNHKSAYTQELVDSINSYWMSELRVDGFRFDFTKGFTNTIYGPDSWGSDYDVSRINILTRMSDEIWSINPNAIVIFEHLAVNAEESVLADNGILLWGNMNHPFSEAVMGYHEDNKSDFSWASYQARNWDSPNVIAYMESHDEERVMYKALSYGNATGAYDVRELEDGILRSAMASVFLMSIPGPKMIWQFGELGYDVSIDEGGRLGQKPPKWDYLENYARESLWRLYANMIHLKKNEQVFNTTNYELNVNGAVKRIKLNGGDVDIRIVGNFDVQENGMSPQFSHTGWWYNHFQGDSIHVTNPNMEVLLNPGEFVFYTSEKLEGFSNVTSSGSHIFENPNQIKVFPNPVIDRLEVEHSDGRIIKELVVYDFSGRVVFSKRDWGRNAFDVSFLPKGFYLVEVITDRNQSSWHKIIKE